jgi:hypothetical protein
MEALRSFIAIHLPEEIRMQWKYYQPLKAAAPVPL